MEYIVYGGGAQIAAAFRTVALFFSHPAIETFCAAAFICGIGYAFLSGSFKGLAAKVEGQEAERGFGQAAWAVLGLAFFLGTALPKTTVNVYDRSVNAHIPVGNVPLNLAWIAGGTNSLEVGFRDMIGASGGTQPLYENGTPFKLIMEATGDYNALDVDYYLHQNVSEYYRRCMVPSKPNMKLLSETSGSLMTELQKAAKPGWYVDFKSDANPNGALMTCQQAFQTLQTELQNSSPSMQKKLAAVCARSNFEVTDAAQLNTCRSQLSAAVNTLFSSSGGYELLFVNSIVANGIRDAMMIDGVEGTMKALVNRGMIQEGMATSTANADWLPVIKAIVAATVISLSMVLVVLFPTPIFGKALKLAVGFWCFVLFWNVIDMIVVTTMMPDAMAQALSEATQNGIGLASMWISPSSSLKALTLLSEVRTSSMNIAVVFVATLVGVSAYGLASYGQRMTSSLEKNAEKAGEETNTERSGALMGAMADSQGRFNAAALHGIDDMAQSTQLSVERDVYQSGALAGDFGSVSGAASEMGTLDAAKQSGEYSGYSNVASDGGQSVSAVAAGTVSANTTQNAAEAKELTEGFRNTSNSADVGVMRGGETLGTLDAKLGESQRNGLTLSEQSQQEGQIAGAESSGEKRPYIGAGGANTEDAANVSEIGSIDKAAELKAKEVLANQAEDNHPGMGGFDNLAMRSLAQQYADVTVNPDPSTSREVAQIEKQEQVTTALTKQDVAERNGETISGMTEQAVRTGTLETLGRNDVAESKSDTELKDVGTDSLSESTSRAAEKAERGDIEAFNEVSAERQVASEHAENRIWDAMLTSSGLSQDDVAMAQAGANMHMALDENTARAFYDAGLIDRAQFGSVMDAGGGRMDASVTLDDDGKISALTTRTSAGDSSSVNDSYVVDDQTVIRLNAETGDVNSTREALQNPSYVASLYSQENGRHVLADKAAGVVGAYERESAESNTTGSVNASLQFNKGNPVGSGAYGSAGISASKNEIETTSYNTQLGAYTKFISAVETTADQRGLEGIERTMFVAEHFTNFFGAQLERAENSTQDQGSHTGTFQDSVAYAKENDLVVPARGHTRDQHDDEATQASVDKQHRHAQEFLYEHERSRLTQDRSAEGQARMMHLGDFMAAKQENANEQPANVEQPAANAQPTNIEQPATNARPANVEQPAANAQPANVEQPAANAQPANVEQPAANAQLRMEKGSFEEKKNAPSDNSKIGTATKGVSSNEPPAPPGEGGGRHPN